MNIKFLDGINPENPGIALSAAIDEIEASTGLNITIHDYRGVLADNDGMPFMPRRVAHRNYCCATGRYSEPGWNLACLADCARDAEQIAMSDPRPTIRCCWKGIKELVVPIVRNQTLIFIIYAGTFRDPSHQPTVKLPEKLYEEIMKLPEITEEKLESYGRVLQLTGHGLLHYIDCYRRNDTPINGRKEFIRQYIADNSHQPVTLEKLAKQLCLSPSRTRHLVIEYFGCSFQELLTRERMERSRNLLRSADTPLQEIAQAVGIDNVYYFNRVFKKFYGVPPGIYRRTKVSFS